MTRKSMWLMMAMAVSACGPANGSGVPVVSAPAPVPTSPPSTEPAPIPTPTPTPTPAPAGQGLACTAANAVIRATSLTITPFNGKVGVVAIGSSSTQGAYASSSATAYPAVLQQLLTGQTRSVTYTVYNKGVGGDALPGTQARLQRDVFDLNPQLVIIQAGTNDSVNDQSAAGLADYTNRLRSVVAAVKVKASVVLMNGQHYPHEPSSYAGYLAAMNQVAQEQNVALFDRYSLMTNWIDSGTYRYTDVLASDSFHPNDFTYRCMAQVMADLIVARTVDR